MQVPSFATPGVVTFEALDSSGTPVLSVTNNPFFITIDPFSNPSASSILRPAPSLTGLDSSPTSSTFDAGSQLPAFSQFGSSFTSTTTSRGDLTSIVSSTFSSSTSNTSSTSTTPSSSLEGSKASVSVGVIVSGGFGAIVGIAIISLVIWFVRRRGFRSVTIRKQNALLFNREQTAANDTVLEPFDLRPDMGHSNATSIPILSTTGYLGMRHSNPSEVVHSRRDLPAEPPIAEPPLSNGIRGSYYVQSSMPRRELDAGPVDLESQSEGGVTLPPNYSDVFSGSRSSREISDYLPSTSHQKP
ncbi:hypothetical protein BDQ17DRAFT_1437155 [Cyathus striatus]|nr:hypothetical protein BDQ17DRAFT_1437155 [Cyathus striatus]